MLFRHKLRNPARLIQVGLIFLGLASAAKLWLLPGSALNESWTDGLLGLLYGISIGCMLLGVWGRRRNAER